MEIKIALDQEDFSCLVRGGQLTIKNDNVEIAIILKDIGFHVMEAEIASAELGNDIYKGHTKIL